MLQTAVLTLAVMGVLWALRKCVEKHGEMAEQRRRTARLLPRLRKRREKLAMAMAAMA